MEVTNITTMKTKETQVKILEDYTKHCLSKIAGLDICIRENEKFLSADFISNFNDSIKVLRYKFEREYYRFELEKAQNYDIDSFGDFQVIIVSRITDLVSALIHFHIAGETDSIRLLKLMKLEATQSFLKDLHQFAFDHRIKIVIDPMVIIR